MQSMVNLATLVRNPYHGRIASLITGNYHEPLTPTAGALIYATKLLIGCYFGFKKFSYHTAQEEPSGMLVHTLCRRSKSWTPCRFWFTNLLTIIVPWSRIILER